MNAIIVTCKENPHTKKRKEMEKQREADLTPLDARNSLLEDSLYPRGTGPDGKGRYSQTPTQDTFNFSDTSGQGNFPLHHMTPAPQHLARHSRNDSALSVSRVGLVDSAAPMPYEPYGHEAYGNEPYRHERIHSNNQFDGHQPHHPVGTGF